MAPIYSIASLCDAFADIISADYERERAHIEKKYAHGYAIRARCGFSSDDQERAARDEQGEINRLRKRRNYLWALMKQNKFYELDEKLETHYMEDWAAHLRMVEVEKDAQRARQQLRRVRSAPLLFSQQKWLYDSIDDRDVPSEPESELDKLISSCSDFLWRPRFKHERIRKYNYGNVDNNNIYQSCEVDNRDYNKLCSLALKLRSVIEYLESTRQKCLYKVRNYMRKSLIEEAVEALEMQRLGQLNETKPQYQNQPESAGGSDKAVTKVAENVVLVESEIPQQENTCVVPRPWSQFVSSDTTSDHHTLVGRWFRVNSYRWTTQDSLNKTLAALDLPNAAILVGDTCDQPNKIPFRIHRYWRGTIEVKIQVNTNKFQIGQLQASWFYQPKADNAFLDLRSDVYARSGGHHVIINASPSNEVTLKIPFKMYKSMLHTKFKQGVPKPLDEGTLFITVLNPLVTQGNTSPEAGFTVFVRFLDNEFTGMIAGDVDDRVYAEDEAQPQYQMMAAAGPLLVKAAEHLLVQDSSDRNRDNPPDNRPPMMLVPTGSHSWCVGTELSEPVHNLRLSGKAQTRHPDVEIDEMSVKYIVRKYQLLSQFVWSTQRNNGDILWDCPANPLPPKNQLHVTKKQDTTQLAAYQLTPVGFISSMFNYWRGSLELRLDIVASQFHAGRLMLAYIPGIAEDDYVTLEQARASPNVVINLQDTLSYTWKIPYIADVPWWPRRYAGNSLLNNHSSPSKVFVYVLNELVLGSTVPPQVEINVYMRGGDDFEVAIPVQPAVGLASDRRYLGALEPINVYPTNPQYYSGSWHQIPSAQAFRRATTSEAYEIFTTPVLDRAGYYRIPASQNLRALNGMSNVMEDVKYAIFLVSPSSYGGFVGLPIRHDSSNSQSINRIKLIATKAFEMKYAVGDWISNFLITTTNAQQSSSYGFYNNTWSTTQNSWGGSLTIPWEFMEPADYLEPFEVVPGFQGNREDTFTMVDNTTSLSGTNDGQMMFGESFTDLKDYCRRYQMYASFVVPGSTVKAEVGRCNFSFPVMPQGLRLDLGTPSGINQIWNRARNGHIPVIASLYRFYRGSIRIRILVTNSSGLQAWYQHRPDRRVLVNGITPCTSLRTAEAIINHGYSYYVQNLDVNNIIELEVPFYQNANFGLLQAPNMSVEEYTNYFSLGEIAVGFFGNKAAEDNMQVTVYYALADDCRFSTFQGVPPLVLLDDLPVNESVAQYQGITDWITNPIASASSAAEDKVKTAIQSSVSKVSKDLLEQIEGATSSIREQVGNSFDKNVVLNAISQFIHCTLNPTFKTIAWAICSILLSCGLIALETIKTVFDACMRIFVIFKNRFGISDELRGENETEPQMQNGGSPQLMSTDQAAATGLITCLMGFMCTVFGIKDARSSKYPKQWSAAIFEGIEKGMRLSNVAFVFLRNIISVLDSMRVWICSKFINGYNAMVALDKSQDIIGKWIRRSVEITTPNVVQDMKYNQPLLIEFYDLYTLGQILVEYIVKCESPNLRVTVHKVFDKLDRVAKTLTDEGTDPHIRKQPYTIYMYGASNIGKSEIQTQICGELLKAENITTPTVMNCVISTASRYWDDCDRQPVLVIDDLFAVQTEELLSRQLETLFAVVSPVVLIPPKAELERKGKPYSPSIFWINSNHEYYKHAQVIPEAVWRRRDILINAEKDDTFSKQDCYHCQNKLDVHDVPAKYINRGDLKDNHHLKFRYKTSCADPAVPYSEWMTYSELLVFLKNHFKENRERETARFRKRVEHNAGVTRSYLSSDNNDIVREWNDAIQARKNMRIKATNIIERVITEHAGHLKQYFKDLKKKFFSMPVEPPTVGCEQCRRIQTRCGQCKYLMENPPVNKASFEPIEDGDEYDEAMNVAMKEVLEDAKQKREQREREKIEEEDLFDPEDPVPSTSSASSSSIEVVSIPETAPKFQNDDNVSVCRNYLDKFFIDNIVNTTSSVLVNLKESLEKFPLKIIESFCKFVRRWLVWLNKSLQQYPWAAHSLNLIYRVCYDLCIKEGWRQGEACCHGRENMLYVRDGKWYIDSSDRAVCLQDVFDNLLGWLNQCEKCVLVLPWYQLELREKCINNAPNHVEEWLELLGPIPILKDKWYKAMISELTSCTTDLIMKRLPAMGAKVWNFITSFKGILTMLGTFLIGSAVMMYFNPNPRAYESFHYSVDYQYDPVSATYQNRYDNTSKRIGKHSAPSPQIAPKFQSYSQQSEQLPRFLDENVVYVHVDYDKGAGVVGNSVFSCFVICGRKMLIQRHYWEQWIKFPPGSKFYLRSKKTVSVDQPLGLPLTLGNLQPEWFSSINSQGYYTSGLGVATLPISAPAFKDLRKFVATAEDHKYFDSQSCYIYDCQTRRQVFMPVHVRHGYVVSDGDGGISAATVYQYRYSANNKCGSVLVCGSLQRPIIGIHYAGTNIWGSSEPLYSENFTKPCEKKTEKYEFDTFFHEMNVEEKDKYQFRNLLYPQGVVPKEVAHHQGGDTQYRPSLLYGVCPVTSEPNPLSPSDRRLPKGSHPLRDGVEHMGKPPREFGVNLLGPAREDLQDVILSTVVPVRAEVDVLTFSDAVVGNNRVHGFEPLEWSTSEGFPLSSARPSGCKGKKWLFRLEENDEGYILKGFHPELKRLLDLEYSMRKKGIRVATVFVDCLKDTVLDSEKCKIPGKTRIFSISPVQYTIAFKMYFGDFLASYRRARLQAEHGIGIDVNSLEWTSLAHRLQEKGNKIVAGDYKNYGPGLMLLAVKYAFDIIMKWYDCYDRSSRRKENQDIRRVLLSEILYSRHLMLDMIYEPSSGIPSGSPITTELNSLVNSLYLRCAWLELTSLSLKHMRENVSIVTYGDDVCVNVSDLYVDQYNTETLNKFFLNYGITFTDINKSDSIVKYRTLDNVTFLKRGFAPHPYASHIYLAPIDRNSIYKCVNWIRSKGDTVESTLINCVQACELAFGLGPDVYNQLKEVLIVECKQQLDKQLVVESWGDVSRRCYGV